jgi:hypothetical protein
VSDDDEEISQAARGLRREWDSPHLWPRIQAALSAEATRVERRREHARVIARFALATAAVLVLGVFWNVHTPRPGAPAERRLLTERALEDVEHAEGEYVRSLDALSHLAESKVEEADSPLMMSYREKLLLLDSAIAECRTRIGGNRFNARLRQELLSLYQEKQRTLQQVMKEDTDAL